MDQARGVFRGTGRAAAALAALAITGGCGGGDQARRDDPAPAAAQPQPAHGQGHGGDHAGAREHHGAAAGPDAHEGGHVNRDFSDVDRWVKVFEGPKRDAWQRPADVIAAIGASDGMTVADIGAGTGYFLPHLRAAVGASGQVLGLDLEATLVAHMNERAKAAGWSNVAARVIAPDDPQLAAGSVDRVLIVDTWHHIAGREAYAAKLRAALREGGAVAIVDFTMDSPHGPAKAHRLLPEQVIAELTAGGLTAALVPAPLPYQFVVLGRR